MTTKNQKLRERNEFDNYASNLLSRGREQAATDRAWAAAEEIHRIQRQQVEQTGKANAAAR